MAKMAADFGKDKIGYIEDAFKAMGGLVKDIADAMAKFTPIAIEAIKPLEGLLDKLRDLAVLVSKFNTTQVEAISKTFGAMGQLIKDLADGLKQFNQLAIDAANALPGLLDALGKLATTVSKFTKSQLEIVKQGFDAIAKFVQDLANSLNLFQQNAINAIGPLEGLLDKLQSLAQAVSKFTTAQIAAITNSFTAMSKFVKDLTDALNTFTQNAVEATKALPAFLDSLQKLALAMA